MNDTTAVPPDCKCPDPEPCNVAIPPQVITHLRVSRLFNLGDYEHKKIEVSVDIPFGVLPSFILIGLERILEAIGEEDPVDDYAMESAQREASRTDEEFKNYHGVENWQSAKADAHKLLDDLQGQREAWKLRQRQARQALDYLSRDNQLPRLPFES